jgi:hypothetical protein
MTMAKKKVRGLDEALNELFANYEKSLAEAMVYAAREASREIKLEAESCLEQYYLNYSPTQYNRTESLLQSFVPYRKVHRKGQNVIADVGMGYDASRLNGVYNGSIKWSPVDGSWVLQNYLLGIHPATNGGIVAGQVEYFEYWDVDVGDRSPTAKMKEFLEKYRDTFNNNILESFAKQITRR